MKNILKRGFTLIELLVVVAIIGILVAYATANYITAQRQARDTRRMQDMESTQTAFETYFSINQAYPASSAEINLAFDSGSRPVDPKSTQSYTWNTLAGGYCICSTMETKTGNANGSTNNGTSYSCSWTSTGNLFCIQSKQ